MAAAGRGSPAGWARLGQVPEWASASPPALRTDVFGGSLRGWQDLLITHGTSILAGQPLLVMDLSGQLASSELTSAAQSAALPAAQYVLPADLDRCGLLSCLSPSQFADALTEAIHAGAPGGARTDRAVDVRVLEQLTAALDGWINPARLAAAAQSALGHPIPPGLLTAQEEMLTGGDLFPAAYRQQIAPNLVRLDAFLADLARYAGHTQAAPPPAPAYYTCLALDTGARSARAEMLTALAIQWLTVQVSASRASAPAVIIAGADEITRPHLDVGGQEFHLGPGRAAPAGPPPPGTGPPHSPGRMAPAGATPRPPSGSTNTLSSQRSCRTSPTMRYCSPGAARSARSYRRWSAIPRSPPCPASAPEPWRRSLSSASPSYRKPRP
jgi:hypothetical protein